MSIRHTVKLALRGLPRGYSADGRSLGVGLSSALDVQRARGAEPLDDSAPARSSRVADGRKESRAEVR